MADTKIVNAKPKKLEKLELVMTTFSGNQIDMTDNILEIALFESIYDYFIHGEITVVDESGILGRIGMIGQEKLLVRFTRDDVEVEKEFFVTDVHRGTTTNETIGTFIATICSEKQMRNAKQVFSRSYSGLNTEIISKIHSDFFQEDLAEISSGGTSHNVVIPYMKPFQAINLIQKNTFALDRTPLFLFENLYDANSKLLSFGDLFAQEASEEIVTRNQANQDEQGQSERDDPEYRKKAFELEIADAFDTIRLFSNGAFSAFANRIDVSTKSIDLFEFDYKKHADYINGNDYLSDRYQVDNRNLNAYRQVKNKTYYQNSLGFESLSNLKTVDPFSKMAMDSYVHRHTTSKVNCHVDSIGGLGCGKTVDLFYRINSPALDKNQNMKDYANSGKYLIANMRHHIHNREYTMSLELVREGIGEEAGI